ncbi:hypothetical protein [Kaarinaea lacus]
MIKLRIFFVVGLVGLNCADKATAKDLRWSLGLDTGAVWQSRNDVQIPGDSGTRFSMDNLVGAGPFPFYRLELTYKLSQRHSLRFLYAPLEYTETGTLDSNVFFVDETFDAGQTTEATYRFNSYRATYRYLFFDETKWLWHVGFTAKVRDAEISLKQDSKFAKDSNVGVVPLLNLYGQYRFTKRWHFIVDFDGLASSKGRAFDLGLIGRYDVAEQWYLAGGYRTLEGGADNDEVYNFAWFNYAFLSIGYRF